MNTKNSFIIIIIFLSGCSIAPGMHMETNSTWFNDDEYVFISSINKEIKIERIENNIQEFSKNRYRYLIGSGDQISVTIWGLPDIFPVSNVSQDQNLRRVDSNGNIFFPYAGLVKANGKTQDELREDLTMKLSEYFTNPQVDVSIAKFNSQQVFVLGEVTKPSKININDTPISLSFALGESFGLNVNTSSAADVFIIRNSSLNEPQIFHADMKNPSNFINANKFYLRNNDIVYVNSSGTARWNRVISQFFPFSSFLNSIDNLVTD